MDKTLDVDPAIGVYSVPMSGHYSITDLGLDPNMMNRVMRIYMPRTFEVLVNKTDSILLHEAPCGSTLYPEVYFDAKWMSWFVKAVQELGISFSMWGGDASFGGGGEGFYTSWGETLIGVLLPFECLEGYNPAYASVQRPHFVDPDHPLARLPWTEAGHVELLNKVETKLGATLIAEAVLDETRYPWIAWWKSGSGRVLGETQVFGSMGTTNRMFNEWRWYQDFVIYLVYFASDKAIPDDVYRTHRLREQINLHADRSLLLISLLEFIEKFGANSVDFYEELEEINLVEKEAEEYYRKGDYDRVAEIFDEIEQAWNGLNRRAVEAKESALLWVYLVEWLAVTGVALVSGVFLWSVMMRRRLYREIRTTSFREAL